MSGCPFWGLIYIFHQQLSTDIRLYGGKEGPDVLVSVYSDFWDISLTIHQKLTLRANIGGPLVIILPKIEKFIESQIPSVIQVILVIRVRV